MKFIKLLAFDLKEGIMKNRMLFLCPLMIVAALFYNFITKVGSLERHGIISARSVSFADFYLFIYGGMKEYILDLGMPFLFPITWLLVFSAIPFILVNYPLRDMQTVGQQVLVRSTGRSRWWISKCCWNVVATIIYHGVIAVAGLVLCWCMKLSITCDLNLDLQSMVFGMPLEQQLMQCHTMPIWIFILPCVTSIAVNLVQMTLSLVIGPMFSFLVTLVILVSSCYLLTPYMIGNYAMIVRLEWIYETGVMVKHGYIIAGVIIIATVLLGKIRFCHYDILNRE